MSEDLHAIDAALVRLRRVWTGPPRLFDHRGQQVELSSVLVVEGCARHAAEGREPDGRRARGVRRRRAVHRQPAGRAGGRRRLRRARSVAGGRPPERPAPDPGREALRADAVAFRLQWLSGTLEGWPDRRHRAAGGAASPASPMRWSQPAAPVAGPGPPSVAD
jgi:hypothetical protein